MHAAICGMAAAIGHTFGKRGRMDRQKPYKANRDLQQRFGGRTFFHYPRPSCQRRSFAKTSLSFGSSCAGNLESFLSGNGALGGYAGQNLLENHRVVWEYWPFWWPACARVRTLTDRSTAVTWAGFSRFSLLRWAMGCGSRTYRQEISICFARAVARGAGNLPRRKTRKPCCRALVDVMPN